MIASVGLTLFLWQEGLNRSDQWSSIIFGAVAALSAIVALLLWLWRRGTAEPASSTAARVDVAVQDLAHAQAEQWKAERQARQMRSPYALPVSWDVTARAAAVMASWSAIDGRPEATPRAIEGSYAKIADVFIKSASPPRLVILGDPGAGKSMLVLQLTLDLLSRRQSSDPVPVLLPAATWQPARPLDDWIADRLSADNPALARPVTAANGSTRSLGREMVARGRVLPILDGLDEMAADHRGAALAVLAHALGSDRQLVVTSRATAYEDAVSRGGWLERTPVVEILPVAGKDVAAYLEADTEQPADRWTAVKQHLDIGGDTPLCRALSTPLMAWLARLVYQRGTTDPSELLHASWATDRASIERHLLNEAIPASYGVPFRGHPARTPDQIRQVQRNLINLARRLHAVPSYDLAWWQVLPRPQLPLNANRLLALSTGSAAALAGYFLSTRADLGGFLAGILLGLSQVMLILWHGKPRRLNLRPSWSHIPGLVAIAAVIAGALAIRSRPSLVLTMTLGLALTIGLGVLAGASIPYAQPRQALSPHILLREDRVVGIVGGLLVALLTATLFVTADLAMNLPLTLGAATAVGSIIGILIGIYCSAWGKFCVARLLLAVRRQTPLRLMTFLHEAYERGVLRQNGGVYQFRHALLQDQLATHSAADPSASSGSH